MAPFSSNDVYDWAVKELGPLTGGHSVRFPGVEAMSRLVTDGKKRRLWKYIVEHVHSRSNVEKIRGLLARKLAQNELHIGAFPKFPDPEHLRQNVTKECDRRDFLKKSLSKIQGDILNIEEDIQKAKSMVEKVHQNSAFLELLLPKYQQDSELLKKVCCVLKQLVNGFDCRKELKNKSDLEFDVTVLLKKVRSVLVNNVSRSEDVSISLNFLLAEGSELLQKHSFKDVVLKLQEYSIKSQMEMVFLPTKEMQCSSSQQSQELLQALKLLHVQQVMSTIQLRKATLDVRESKTLLWNSSFNSESSADAPQMIKRSELFEKMSENRSLSMNILFLKETLKVEINKQSGSASELDVDLKSVVQIFCSDFKTLHLLLNSSGSAYKYILHCLDRLDVFIGNELTSSISALWVFDAVQFRDLTRLDIQLSLDYFTRQNLPGTFRLVSLLPESLCELFDVFPFQNGGNICHRFLHTGRDLVTNFSANKLDVSSVRETCASMKEEYCRKISCLAKAESVAASSFFHCDRLGDEICDWWKQGAQHIPKIEYEGKTLQMWLDSLAVMSDF